MAADGELAEVARYPLWRPEYFAKRIAEITDNKFQIQVFAAGEIVPGLQVLDAVQNGTVEMGNTAPYYYFGKDPAFTFGTALPFGLNTRQQNAWLPSAAAEADERVLQDLQLLGYADRQHRRARWAAGSARRSRRSMTSRA